MNRRIFNNHKYAVFYPLVLLLIPFFGMLLTDEVNWSLFDFILMGALILLLSFGIQYTLRKSTNKLKRILLIGLLILLFILIWAELAVGLFGSPFAGN